MRSVLIAGFVVLAVALVPDLASADYVCGTSYRPATMNPLGSEGYLSISVYTGQDCSGTLVGNYWLCTAGATATNCASSASFRYERHGLLAVYRAALDAMINNTRVFLSTTPCNGGATGCGAYLNHWGDF